MRRWLSMIVALALAMLPFGGMVGTAHASHAIGGHAIAAHGTHAGQAGPATPAKPNGSNEHHAHHGADHPAMQPAMHMHGDAASADAVSPDGASPAVGLRDAVAHCAAPHGQQVASEGHHAGSKLPCACGGDCRCLGLCKSHCGAALMTGGLLARAYPSANTVRPVASAVLRAWLSRPLPPPPRA